MCARLHAKARDKQNLKKGAKKVYEPKKIEDFQIDESKSPDKRPREYAWRVYEHYMIGRASWSGMRIIHAPKWLYRRGEKGKERRFHKNEPKTFEEGRDWYSLERKWTGGYLFVNFAHLVEKKDLDVPPRSLELDTDKNAQVALEWAQEWGVLGLTKEKEGEYNPRGGTADTVAAFAREAWAANSVLRLYEEATSDGGPRTEVVGRLLEEGGVRPPLGRLFYAQTQEHARDIAMRICEETTMSRVRAYCYPALFRDTASYKYTQGFGCANLLGAIWMGMYWTLWSDPDRCRRPGCNRIVPRRPTPERRGMKPNDRSEGYATRKNKRYCSDRCQQQHYYQTKIKPKRQAARKN